MNPQNELPPGQTPPSAWIKLRKQYRNWYALQSGLRLTVFVCGCLGGVLLFAFLARHLSRHEHHLTAFDCAAFGLCELSFLIWWPMCALKWKRFHVGRGMFKRPSVWLLTVWLCVFIGMAHEGTARATGTVAAATTLVAQAYSNSGSNPNIAIHCDLWLALFFLAIVATFIIMFIYLLCSLGLCGKKGNQPPATPGGADQNSRPHTGNVNANVNLPSTVFYLNNGMVVSNSAGLTQSTLPSFMSLLGQKLPNGAQISSSTPGITTPPSVSLWIETNTWYDANLDPTHPYVAMYNFSMLTTTSLSSRWRELCTVVGWVNNNVSCPLVCTITYTNGTAATTNWAQCFLDSYLQPTNIVVYGTIASLKTEHTPVMPPPQQPDTGQQTLQADDGILMPPLPGTICTNNCPPYILYSEGQYFRLTCNTNDVVTRWP